MADIILTGIPRSGTTLTCSLLNKLPNTVALHEPISDWGEGLDPKAICDLVDEFFAQSRKTLLQSGTAISKQFKGQVPDNPVGEYPLLWRILHDHELTRKFLQNRIGLRKSRVARGSIKIQKPLSEDFWLCIKHNGHFTTLLPHLRSKEYPCYAIIRHPLAVLASWNSIQFGPYHGRMYSAERINASLALKLDAIDERLERQLTLLTWFFEVYQSELPAENIIRYEDIISSGGAELQRIVSCASELNEPLKNKNQNKDYNRQLMHQLMTKLNTKNGPYWDYYPREAIGAS